MKRPIAACSAFTVFLFGCVALAAETRVAVAANFAPTMQELARGFFEKTGHRAEVVSGATGKLYAQIKNGAPFDALLSADEKTPKQLEDEGLTVRGTRFTYAIGKLALYSERPGFVDAKGAVLRSGSFEHLAIANPKLAPYGAAAVAVLKKLGLFERLRPRLVEGENIAQTLQFVASGNAELGFVAWSQVLVANQAQSGSFWLVPQELYPLIRQDAVTLQAGAKNPALSAFMDYLKSEAARSVIAKSGYGLPAVEAVKRSSLSAMPE